MRSKVDQKIGANDPNLARLSRDESAAERNDDVAPLRPTRTPPAPFFALACGPVPAKHGSRREASSPTCTENRMARFRPRPARNGSCRLKYIIDFLDTLT